MASANSDAQPLRPAKMFKYGTFSRLFGGASSKKAEDTDADATASVSEQQQPQQQPPSAEAAAAAASSAPAAASAAAPAKSARPKCLRVSLIVMFSSGVILAVGLLAGLLTRHTHAADSDNSTGSANATGRPNIVFIMTDDQDRRLGSTDYQEVLHRELIQKGVEFSNHYTTQALCCPARSSLLRGQQIHNTNITNVVKPGYATPLPLVICARA